MLASTSFQYHYHKYISYRDVNLYFSASHNSAGIGLGRPAITCSKLTIKTLERRSGVFIVNFELVDAGWENAENRSEAYSKPSQTSKMVLFCANG